MIILGIDQGYANCGWSIIQERKGKFKVLNRGIINTEPYLPLPYRIEEIYKELQEIVKHYKNKIDIIITEKLSGGKVNKVKYINGILVLIANITRCYLMEIPPTYAKRKLTGYGGSDKEPIMEYLAKKYGIYEDNDHIADSINIGIQGSFKLKENLKKEKDKYEEAMEKWNFI